MTQNVSLTERAEKKQLMQNITFTNQMQNQMLNLHLRIRISKEIQLMRKPMESDIALLKISLDKLNEN